MKTVISVAMFNEICADQLRVSLGVRHTAYMTDCLRAACKAVGVSVKATPREELKRLATDALNYLCADKKTHPADKEGQPLTAKAQRWAIAGVVDKLLATSKSGGATKKGKLMTPDAPDDDDDGANVTPPKPPATFPNSDVLDKIRALCALCAKSKDANAKALATVVAEFFA